MQEVLNIAKEVEKVIVEKKSRTQQRKQPTVMTVEEQEDKVLEDISSNVRHVEASALDLCTRSYQKRNIAT